jgi:hypothetical protein
MIGGSGVWWIRGGLQWGWLVENVGKKECGRGVVVGGVSIGQ